MIAGYEESRPWLISGPILSIFIGIGSIPYEAEVAADNYIIVLGEGLTLGKVLGAEFLNIYISVGISGNENHIGICSFLVYSIACL